MNDLQIRIQKERRQSRLSVAVLVVCVAVLLSLIYVFLYRLEVVPLPTWLVEIFNIDAGKSPFGDEEEQLYAALQEGGALPKEVTANPITEDKYLSLIEAATLPEEMTVSYRITMYGEDNSKETKVSFWRSGARYYLQKLDENGDVFCRVRCDGTEVNVTELVENRIVDRLTYPVSDGFVWENEVGIPSVTSFLRDPEIENVEIRLLHTQDYNMFYVSYTYTDTGIVESLCISMEDGLILACEAKKGNDITYSCRLTEYTKQLVGYGFPETQS